MLADKKERSGTTRITLAAESLLSLALLALSFLTRTISRPV